MTDFVIGLIPQYGLYLIFGVIFLACLGVPLPSSILVLTSGALAASGELSAMYTLATVWVAYCVSDQIAFCAARAVGPPFLARLRRFKRMRPLADKSQKMLQKRGWLAVFLSHTIISPASPYVSYISGAVQMNWFQFTSIAIVSAALWTAAYFSLGYLFAADLPQMTELVYTMLLAIGSSTLAIALAIWLQILWRHFEE